MAKENGQERERRHFTAEFKVEVVRRVAERRAAGVPMTTQIARDLDVRDDLLRKWQRQAGERASAPPNDVFPGNGRLSVEEDEVWRLKRELARAAEIAFLKGAAA